MRLCMINSLLVVCFYNGFKQIKSVNFFIKFHEKAIRNGYKSTFTEYSDQFSRNIRGKLHIFLKFSFPAGRSTKHLVGRLSAYYIGFNR